MLVDVPRSAQMEHRPITEPPEVTAILVSRNNPPSEMGDRRSRALALYRPLEGRFYQQMVLIRLVEEKLLELFNEGRIHGTTHTSIGQEANAVGILNAIDRDCDIVWSNHRCHGHFLAYSGEIEGLIAEVMGKSSGVSGGRGGSQHLCHRNFHSNGIQGGIVPIAVGSALAKKATGAIAIVFLGDGTMGEGLVYESLNLAALYRAREPFYSRAHLTIDTNDRTARVVAVKAHPRVGVELGSCPRSEHRTELRGE